MREPLAKYSISLGWVSLGVLCATFLGSSSLVLLLGLSDSIRDNISVSRLVYDYFDMMFYVFPVGLLVTIFASVIVAFPLYAVARMLGMVNRFSLVCGGALVPIIFIGLFEVMDPGELPPITDRHSIVALVCMAFCGAVGGGISCNGWRKPPV